MQLFIGSKLNDNTLVLTEEESWHCAKVLRKKSGDLLSVIDGKGNLYSGKIISDNAKRIVLSIESHEYKSQARNYRLHLAIAPTKNIDRIEWFIEKAVEIGIDEISFLQSKNSERKVVKMERIQKIVESAVKQSVQYFIPQVTDIQSYQAFINTEASNCSKFIAHCQTDSLPYIGKLAIKGANSIILIGPEGDFTIDEVSLAKQAGYQEIGLGDTRLRTETAALYAVNFFSVLSHN